MSEKDCKTKSCDESIQDFSGKEKKEKNAHNVSEKKTIHSVIFEASTFLKINNLIHNSSYILNCYDIVLILRIQKCSSNKCNPSGI